VQQLWVFQSNGVSERTGKSGLASANILKTKGGGNQFSRFYADVFYERPKSKNNKVILHFLYFILIFFFFKKSSLYSLTLLSGTSDLCPSPWLYTKAHIIKVATVVSRWQRVGDLIGSGLERYSSRIRSERLTTFADYLNDVKCCAI